MVDEKHRPSSERVAEKRRREGEAERVTERERDRERERKRGRIARTCYVAIALPLPRPLAPWNFPTDSLSLLHRRFPSVVVVVVGHDGIVSLRVYL